MGWQCQAAYVLLKKFSKILQFTSLHYRTRTRQVHFWSTTKKLSSFPILNKVSQLSLSQRTLFYNHSYKYPYHLLHTRPGELNRIHSATKLPVCSQGTPFQSPSHSKNHHGNLPGTTAAGRKLLESWGCLSGGGNETYFCISQKLRPPAVVQSTILV